MREPNEATPELLVDALAKCGEKEKALRTRIAELEKALKPFSDLLLNLRTDQIEPRAMFVVERPDGDDCDLVGADIIRARKALNK